MSFLPKWLQQIAIFAAMIVGFFVTVSAGAQIHASLQDMSRSNYYGGKLELVATLPVTGVDQEQATTNRELISNCTANLDNGSPAGRDSRVDAKTGSMALRYGAAGPIVECLLTHRTERLCSPASKSALVKILADYAALHRRAFATYTKIRRTVPKEQLDAAAGRHPSSNDDIATGELINEALPVNVASAIRDLADDGFLRATDFNGGAPQEIAPYLVKPRSKACL